jgi:hypothetical protein
VLSVFLSVTACVENNIPQRLVVAFDPFDHSFVDSSALKACENSEPERDWAIYGGLSR